MMPPSSQANTATTLVRCGGSSESPLRLLAFPWAGAGIAYFRRFAHQLGNAVEFWAVLLPARESRYSETGLTRMEDIVAAVMQDLMRLEPRPLALFGHSMGALAAFETAAALQRQGNSPLRQLIVSGSGAPHNPTNVHRCPAHSDDQTFIRNLAALGGTPDSVLNDTALIKSLIPALRADYQVLDQYQPTQLRLSVPIHICLGSNDSCVAPGTEQQWQQYGELGQQQSFSGDHFYLCHSPATLAQHLKQLLHQDITRIESSVSQPGGKSDQNSRQTAGILDLSSE